MLESNQRTATAAYGLAVRRITALPTPREMKKATLSDGYVIDILMWWKSVLHMLDCYRADSSRQNQPVLKTGNEAASLVKNIVLKPLYIVRFNFTTSLQRGGGVALMPPPPYPPLLLK